MKYCNKCKRIYNDEDINCSHCISELTELKDPNTPVYLLTASGFELQRVKTALEDCAIPNDTLSCKHNYSAEAVSGYDRSEYDILVPYSAYEKAYDTCVGIGAINIGEEEIIADDENSVNSEVHSFDEQFEKMSGVKRTTIRVVTAVLFLALVALAVYGTDFIMDLLKNLFT